MKRVLVCLALVSVGLMGVMAAPAWCAAEAPKLGVVDMDRVATEYREMQVLNAQFQDFQREQERQLRESHQIRMLTEAERQEYTDKSSMAAPTETTKTRLTELENLSTEREQRLMELRKKTDLSDEEKAEAEDLGARYEARMSELASLQADLQASRTAKYEELSSLIADNVNAAIKAVAETQQIAMVFRKDTVLVGGVDITGAVVEKLNAPKAAAAPAK